MKIITDIKQLRIKSDEVSKEEAKDIIKYLESHLNPKKGIGLSAIQIGIPKRVSIIRRGNLKIDLINTKIIGKQDKIRFRGEGCLSFPLLYIDTLRYNQIKFENEKLDGTKYIAVSTGIEAVAIQHEVNHMEGKLFIDKGIKWQKQR